MGNIFTEEEKEHITILLRSQIDAIKDSQDSFNQLALSLFANDWFYRALFLVYDYDSRVSKLKNECEFAEKAVVLNSLNALLARVLRLKNYI